jgi:hypothetical protein
MTTGLDSFLRIFVQLLYQILNYDYFSFWHLNKILDEIPDKVVANIHNEDVLKLTKLN